MIYPADYMFFMDHSRNRVNGSLQVVSGRQGPLSSELSTNKTVKALNWVIYLAGGGKEHAPRKTVKGGAGELLPTSDQPNFISQKVLIKSFCKSQFPHKFVN